MDKVMTDISFEVDVQYPEKLHESPNDLPEIKKSQSGQKTCIYLVRKKYIYVSMLYI